jgi:RHS repeat-associated protein
VLTIDHTRGNRASLSWLLYDGHGNLVRTMAPNYTLSAFQWRGVWGEVQSSLGTGRGYCANLGHPEDETGLVYMRARYYEPATGRFINEDPARDGVNWYLYADGNPVAKADVTGKTSIETALIFMFIIWWQQTILDPKLWGPSWQAFLNLKLAIGSALLVSGAIAFEMGAAMVQAASVAYRTPTARGAIILSIQGSRTMQRGAQAMIAGAFLLYSYWYGATIGSHEEFLSDASLMLGFYMNALSIFEGG